MMSENIFVSKQSYLNLFTSKWICQTGSEYNCNSNKAYS